MTTNYLLLSPYFLALFISAGIMLYVFLHRNAKGAATYFILSFCETIYVAGFLLETLSTTLPQKIFWDNAQWLPTLILPVAYLIFVYEFIGYKYQNIGRLWLKNLVFPILFFTLVIFDPWLKLIRPSFRIVEGLGIKSLYYPLTPIVYLFVIFVYSYMIYAIYIAAWKFRSSADVSFRAQIGIIIIAFVIPLIIGVLPAFDLLPPYIRDINPLSFGLSNLILAIGIYRTHLFSVIPIARDLVVETMESAIVVLDSQNCVVDVNISALKLLNKTIKDVIGIPVIDVFVDYPQFLEKYINQETVEDTISVEDNGRMSYFDLGIKSIYNKQNKLVGRLVSLHNITERKQVENELQRYRNHLEELVETRTTALHESEQRYRLISDLSTDYVFSSIVHRDGTVEQNWQSGAFESISGYTSEEIRTLGWRATVHPEDLVVDDQILANLYLNQRASRDLRIVTKNGETRWIKDYAHPVWDNHENRLVGIYGAVQDITERKRAEESLRQRDAILQAVAYAAQVFLQSSNWRDSINLTLKELGEATHASHSYIFENHVLQDGTEVTSQKYEWTAPNVQSEIDNPKYQNVLLRDGATQYWVGLLSKGQTYVGDMEMLPSDEVNYFNERGIKSILDVAIFVGGKWWGVIGFDDYFNERAWSIAEIEALEVAAKLISAAIERDQINQKERASEERYRELFEQSQDAISIISLDRKLLRFNERANELLKNELIIGEDSISNLSLPEAEDAKAKFAQVVAGEKVPIYERAMSLKNGQTFFAEINLTLVCDTNGNPWYVQSILRDVTERKRAEESLRQRDAILQAVAHAAQVFLQSSNWRESINQTLKELGEVTHASHSYIFENHILQNGTEVTSQKYEWTAPNVQSEIDDSRYQDVPVFDETIQYWTGLLSKGKTYIRNLETFPNHEVDYIQNREIKSTLDVPIFVGGKWWGVIGFDDYFNERAWSIAEIEAIEVAAKMIAAAITSEHINESIRVSEERYRKAIVAADSVPYTLDYETNSYTFMGEMIEHLTGYSAQEITPAKLEALIHETVMLGDLDEYSRSEAADLVRAGELHPNSWRADLRIITKKQEERWVSDSSVQIKDKNGEVIGSIGILQDITERKRAEETFRANEEKVRELNISLEQRVEERTTQLQAEKAKIENIARDVATLRRLSDFLQSSESIEEASSIISKHMNVLFPFTSGAIYLNSNGITDIGMAAMWGTSKAEDVIQPSACWGMRRGRAYYKQAADASPVCLHFKGQHVLESMCLPLLAHGEAIGMISLQISGDGADKYFSDEVQNLAIASVDSISLAIANLRLREHLHSQTIRDPLTGLFNRRFMEETLTREVHRASRSQIPLCVVMFEIDDFKQYNNTFGHEAGDYVLKKVADTMRAKLRRSDFPCRYGGDEFTFLLPETTLEDGAHRAEELRKAVEALALSFNNQALGQVTVRMGVAAYPQHGETGDVVLQVADAASYKARSIGKNCVVIAE